MEFNPAAELLDRHVTGRGNKTALLCDGLSVSYAELRSQINRYAHILQSAGLTPGDRVLVSLPDSPEFVFAFLGSILAGGVPVPCSDQDAKNLEFILRDCCAAALFGLCGSFAAGADSPFLKNRFLVDSLEFRARLDSASAHFQARPVSADEVCFMLYTSGSTGKPKGISHRGAALLPESDHFGRDILRITPEDVLFSVSKMHFGFGLLNSVVHGLGAGATVSLLPRRPTLQGLREIITRCSPTILFAVPAVYTLLLDNGDGIFRGAPLRLCVSSGEALESGLCRDWKERTGVEIIDSVGATETFHAFIAGRPGDIVPGAAGAVIPPWEARVVDEAGNEVADGLPGYIQVRGPYITRETERCVDADGWLATGDMFLVREGIFTFVGRGDDMFKCDGNWVSPLPIESALRLHPSVKECAVRARRILGTSRPVAHVVLKPGVIESTELERDMFVFLRLRLPDHMCPVQFTFHPELPKTITGKLCRGALDRLDSGARNSVVS